jgi:hypothetical protein
MCLQIAFFFFGTYMMAAVLLLLNMLIAILMDVYGQVWSLEPFAAWFRWMVNQHIDVP